MKKVLRDLDPYPDDDDLDDFTYDPGSLKPPP